MTTIKIADIRVEDRQRTNLGDLDRDFESIREIGLIQPIVVETVSEPGTLHQGLSFRLISGGRRLAWLTANGFTELWHGVTCDPARPGFVFASELTTLARQEAELYENIKRQGLHWTEECRAIARVHRLRWIESKSEAVAWSQKHTARLLGIDSNSKVGYALQVADALKDDPEIAKCESFHAAIRYLMVKEDNRAREEQQRRWAMQQPALVAPPQPDLFDSPDEVNLVTGGPGEPPLEVYMENRMRNVDFLDAFARGDVFIDTYRCAMVFGEFVGWTALYAAMKMHSYVVWLHGGFWRATIVSEEMFKIMPHPVVWNALLEQGDVKESDLNWPFAPNLFFIDVLYKGDPFPVEKSLSSVVSANPDGLWPPTAVLDFLLKPVSRVGDVVLLPNGGPVRLIAELGRTPICYEADAVRHAENVEAMREYFKIVTNGNVIFK
jgi:ParB-like chromosome segregation protein Spo0J